MTDVSTVLSSSSLSTALIIAVGVFGLIIGSFLNVVIWRVPRGESLLTESRCPHCHTKITPLQNIPVISWLMLGGRCARCRTRISARYPLIELCTGMAFAAVTWWCLLDAPIMGVAWWLALAAYLWFAAVSIVLTAIDLEHRRLPDAIVLPSVVIVTVLLGLSAALGGEWGRVLTTLVAAAAVFAFYVVISLVYPAGIGGGDIKLAPVLGAALGYMGWAAVIVGVFAGFAFGAVFGLVMMALRRATRKSGIPFGPFMLLGAWVGATFGTLIGDAYLRVTGLR